LRNQDEEADTFLLDHHGNEEGDFDGDDDDEDGIDEVMIAEEDHRRAQAVVELEELKM